MGAHIEANKKIHTGVKVEHSKIHTKINKEKTMQTKNLKQVKIGHTAVILKINGEGALKRRIQEMGLTKGTEIYVRKVAPLGDPIEITVRGYELSLRKQDAELIEVK
ncbi:hypothetical protein FACS1894132_07590 [Clostridia bacterium]|nr:hypothetical protein FACS1894132_07590 [Clostridia bacterium]